MPFCRLWVLLPFYFLMLIFLFLVKLWVQDFYFTTFLPSLAVFMEDLNLLNKNKEIKWNIIHIVLCTSFNLWIYCVIIEWKTYVKKTWLNDWGLYWHLTSKIQKSLGPESSTLSGLNFKTLFSCETICVHINVSRSTVKQHKTNKHKNR